MPLLKYLLTSVSLLEKKTFWNSERAAKSLDKLSQSAIVKRECLTSHYGILHPRKIGEYRSEHNLNEITYWTL